VPFSRKSQQQSQQTQQRPLSSPLNIYLDSFGGGIGSSNSSAASSPNSSRPSSVEPDSPTTGGLNLPRNYSNPRRSAKETIVTPSTIGEQNMFGKKLAFKKAANANQTSQSTLPWMNIKEEEFDINAAKILNSQQSPTGRN